LRETFFSHSINAALIAFDDVFGAFDGDAGAEDRAKEIEFSRAETLAGVRRSADRTMVLDEEKAAFAIVPNLGHITFLGSDASEPAEFVLQWERMWYSLQIIGLLFGAA